MEISVTIKTQEIANAPEGALANLAGALQEIARCAGEVCPVSAPQNPQKGADGAETVKKDKTTASAATKAQKGAEKVSEAKQTPPAEKPESVQEEPVKEEPAKKDEAAKTDVPSRDAVRKRLSEIRNEDESKAPKILEILHEFGVKRFSDLPDENLAEVLAKAEAL